MKSKTNSYYMDEDSFLDKLSKRGVRGISGHTFGDEATHNSHDAKATSQFLCFDKNVLMWGNNGDPLYWDDFESSYLKYKRPGRTAAKTGYWGVGGSKFLPYCDGLPSYQLTTYDGKYFKRIWEWENKPSGLTTKTINQIVSCSIVEYEINEDEYRDLCRPDLNRHVQSSEFFTELPNFVMCIDRFTDSTMIYDAKAIMNHINFATMNFDNFETMIYDYTGSNRGNLINSKKLFYPTMIESKGSIKKTLPTHYSQLPLKKTRMLYNGAKLDIYLFNVLTSGQDYETMKQMTDKGKDLLPLHTNWFGAERGKNPREIFVDSKGMSLVLTDPWQKGMKEIDKNPKVTPKTCMVIHHVSGDLEMSTIKTEGFDDEFTEKMIGLHRELVLADTTLHYNPKADEDQKVDEIVVALTDDADPNLRATSMISIMELTDNKLDINDITDATNYSVRKEHGAGSREHDMLIKKTDDDSWIIHFEFQNFSEDWKHIDGFWSRIGVHEADYNVLVVDNFQKSGDKLKMLKHNCKRNKIDAVVWCITYSDFINGDIKEFKKIWELK